MKSSAFASTSSSSLHDVASTLAVCGLRLSTSSSSSRSIEPLLSLADFRISALPDPPLGSSPCMDSDLYRLDKFMDCSRCKSEGLRASSGCSGSASGCTCCVCAFVGS
ncbi:hypothetical protein V8G54_017529 [Vigna mungo]|uniref:Uncharacterized protein n=1 Tax=Vigna mungo TaxID=3915 RepID=A0AAQ3RYT7_VIGMU